MDAARPLDANRHVGASRDRVTIDLRGLGPRLHAQAAKRQVTAATLVRRALVSLLDEEPRGADDVEPIGSAVDTQAVKVTLRLSSAHAVLLARRARLADVSQGRYVAGLIDGAPPQPRAPDHTLAVAALMASTDRLAVLSADLNAFMRLLGRAQRSELEPYRASIQSLGADVRGHLASAAALVTSLRAAGERR
jgi:hypothetical protein